MSSTGIEKHCSGVGVDYERTNNHIRSLGARVGVVPAPSGGKSWRSAPAGRSDSTREEVLEPAVRQEELPAVEPEVLAELGERHETEVLETSGPGLPAAAVEAGTATAAAGTAGEARGEDGCCCQKQLE